MRPLEAPAVGSVLRLPQRTPFPIAEVNCHLILGDPVTLVDAGTNTDDALEDLEAGLRGAGLRVEDIEFLLLTHHHADHAGLARRIRERSSCVVVGHELMPLFLDDVPAARQAEADYQAEIMALHGASPGLIAEQRDLQRRLRVLIESVELDHLVADGDIVHAGGRDLRVIFRPGHSRTDTLFMDGAAGVMYGGDHLLGHISSNPTAIKPVGPPVDLRSRASATLTYREALLTTAEMAIDVIHTGHGDPVREHREVIAQRLATQDGHAQRVLREFGPHVPRTAHQIAQGLWPKLAAKRPFLAISLVLESVDLLVDRGRLRQRDDEDVVAYELA
jgi:glyoxylase-like metal-dependent hydrolase (beta-lactamase superfamily II)